MISRTRVEGRGGRVIAFLVVLALAQVPRLGHAQKLVEANAVKFPEYYEPPHQTQLKSLLEGAKVQPQPDGLYLVTEAKLQTWSTNGERQMVVEAPECMHDSVQRLINSPGKIRAQAADGKFSIEGEGFLWRQTNWNLFISNRVHTIVQSDLLGPRAATERTNKPPPAAKGLEIFSDRFEFQYTPDPGSGTNSGLAIYRGDVGVVGTNLALTSGLLKVAVPMSGPQRPSGLQSITAEQNVIMDYEDVQATGERAVYSAETGRATITGHPAWRAEQAEGRGDELIIERADKSFRADGHAYLKMPGQTLGASGFLPRQGRAATNSLPATNQWVEVRSDSYQRWTNFAVFRDGVLVTERAGDELKGKMSCTRMTLAFLRTNELQQMVAEDKVVIEQDERQLTGGKAVYTVTNGVLDLTGNPQWRAGLREGKGDLLRVNVQQDEMLVRGHATMRLPADELGQARAAGPGVAPRPASAFAGDEFAEIFADEYSLKPEAALFRGQVRVDHPRMRCTCGEMTGQFPAATGQTRHLLMEQAVVFDLTDERGQKVHGLCEKALYTYAASAATTNNMVELTGNPILETADATFQNRVIVLDRASSKLMAQGNYRVYGRAAAGTNLFQLPKR